MDFQLSDEHLALRDTLRDFFAKEAPVSVVADMDRRGEHPTKLLQKMADLGCWGISFGEEFGGIGADEVGICTVIEEVALAGDSVIFAWMPTATFCAKAIALHGSAQQRADFLPRVAAGDLRFGMGLSEPDVGSDLMHVSTRARRDGDEFVVSGQKIFTSGAEHADYILTLARTDPDASSPSRGLSLLFVPSEDPGVTVRPLRTLAGHGTHTCEVFIDEVRVPQTALLGSENGGARVILSLLDAGRVHVAAQALGIARGALELATNYANERVQFGKSIIDHQAVGHMLADMRLDVEGARLLVQRAAWKMDRGLDASLDASLAKVAASEAATRCADRGMSVLGGYSYMVEYGMERFHREAKLTEIVDGTNQIQRNIIAKRLAAGS